MAAAGPDDQQVKLVILGDTGVGKSSLVLRFVNNIFKPFSESTIGAAFLSKELDVDGSLVKFQIWDTAGQEKSSFATLKSWVAELQSKGPENIVVAVAGNKCDMDSKRKVSTEEARSYADSIGALFLETSAKADINVQELFVAISQRLPAPGASQFDDEDPVVDIRKKPSKPKDGCC